MVHRTKRGFDFGSFEITKREILASISIIAVMMLIGVLITEKISEHHMDNMEIYNKAAKIESAEIFQYGMKTDIGNAFVYGNLEAVDVVTYPELHGEYVYIEKVKKRYERHERTVITEDSEGNEYTEIEVYYEWERDTSEKIHSNEIIFCGTTFPYSKISIPSAKHIDTLYDGLEYSWKSGEFVRVKYEYYGVSGKLTGTIFTDLRDGTISNNSVFYNDMTIEETIEHLESKESVVVFWFFWMLFICACVFGFYYLDNEWLE